MVRSRGRRPPPAPPDELEANLTRTQGDIAGSWVVGMDCRSMNLFRFLRVQLPDASRGLLRGWMAEGTALINGEAAHSSQPLRTGDVVSVPQHVGNLPRDHRGKRKPQILYEDADLIAVAKPSGLATVPERESRRASLLELLKGELDERGLRLVHRLDKHASGIVVFARHREAKRALIEEFTLRRVTKDYLALVSGCFPEQPERIEERLVPIPGRRPRMAVRADAGKESTTLVRQAMAFRGYSVVHAQPITGRTHQIRVHLSHRGYPLIGDEVYGGPSELMLSKLKSGYRRARGEAERPLIDRLALHAYRIRLRSPAGPMIDIQAELPPDLLRSLKQLHKARPEASDAAFATFLETPLGPDQPPPFAALS